MNLYKYSAEIFIFCAKYFLLCLIDSFYIVHSIIHADYCKISQVENRRLRIRLIGQRSSSNSKSKFIFSSYREIKLSLHNLKIVKTKSL